MLVNMITNLLFSIKKYWLNVAGISMNEIAKSYQVII